MCDFKKVLIRPLSVVTASLMFTFSFWGTGVRADGSDLNAWWKQNCADSDHPPADQTTLSQCINYAVANGLQGVKEWMSHLEQERREVSSSLNGAKDLYADNLRNAQGAYYVARGFDIPFQNNNQTQIMAGLGSATNELSVDSKGPGIASKSSRAMNVRIAEQLAQAAQKYTTINGSATSAADQYLRTVLPHYCPRDLSEYLDPNKTSGSPVGVQYCLNPNSTDSSGAPSAFGNFDIMASSLLGPSNYLDNNLANTYAWLNHSNWTAKSQNWSKDLPNRFGVWLSNPGQFEDAARDFITMVMGPNYTGLNASKAFNTDSKTGQWQVQDKAIPYVVGVRQVAALRSLALNSFYSIYYDRYPENPKKASNGAVTQVDSVLSFFEKEVNKRFGNTTDYAYCLPAKNDGGNVESTECKSRIGNTALPLNQQLPALNSGQIYIQATWNDFVDSLPPELVGKEMAHMMAVDLALRLKAYKQSERVEALLAAQLGILAKQLEIANDAMAGIGQQTAADVKGQFNTFSGQVSGSSSK